ncbi:MAG: hypothetical protein ACJATI_005445 [Halioglobus sp.]|jgi:hypothetical protein
MELNYSKNQHILLGKIIIDKQLISEMESEHLFHDFVYSCLMLHETGECERRTVDQMIKSNHIYKLSNMSFNI